MKFFLKDFFSKCDQIRSFLRIWSHLLKKSLMEHFIFCTLIDHNFTTDFSIQVYWLKKKNLAIDKNYFHMSKNIIFEISYERVFLNIHFKLFLTEIIHLVSISENFANEVKEWSDGTVLFCLICTLIGSYMDAILPRKGFRPKCFKFWSLYPFLSPSPFHG